MRAKFVEKTTKYILKYYDYNGKKLDKIKYGLAVLFSLFTKTLVIVICSMLLGTTKSTLFLILIYSGIRLFSFGIHAAKTAYCWMVTIPLYGILPLIINVMSLNSYIKMLSIIFALTSLFLYSPSDTKHRPLINPKKRRFAKVASVTIGTVYSLFLIFSTNVLLQNTIFVVLILQSIVINPITYKIFKMPYNNYLTYVKPV